MIQKQRAIHDILFVNRCDAIHLPKLLWMVTVGSVELKWQLKIELMQSQSQFVELRKVVTKPYFTIFVNGK